MKTAFLIFALAVLCPGFHEASAFLADEEVHPSGHNDTDGCWMKNNNPCPDGWRVPKQEEFERLCDAEKVVAEWLKPTDSSIKRLKFTDSSTHESIFLPAAGAIDDKAGRTQLVGVYGLYWSATPVDCSECEVVSFEANGIHGSTPPVGSINESRNLLFFADHLFPWDSSNRACGFPVRCVKEA